MKFQLAVIVTKLDGPRAETDVVYETLCDEIETFDFWVDDTNYRIDIDRAHSKAE